ncbi:hypothetical protein [Flagellimonas allohymeniacidonis]|uniref:Uncharacterized protein n=1 Tax=Flagellimonas allohymeniacidonis TaxID=2517819 RepID=A0A4Q8QJA8_9FLAO|nr:hypothetical protein [Allomuricauda hymeniacidonis]TAI48316.1 hypothetical protein EW142_00450 [Allomuricauda hymeniacidonis]
MDKLSSREEEQLKKAVQKVGLEKPSMEFTANVMTALERKMVRHIKPAPLLSKKGWSVIILVFVVCCSLIYFYPKEGIELFDQVRQFRLGFARNIFEGVQISRTMVFAISLLGLFLLQLPFLMQLVNKQRTVE